MNLKKYLIASLSGFIVMFLLGWLGHEYILTAINSGADPLESLMRSEPNVLGIGLAYFILSLIMAYMYPKGIEGNNVLKNGLRFGVLIGLLFSLPISIIFYSVYEGITISMILSEAVWHAIEQGIGGIAIAYVSGKPSSFNSD